VARISFPDRKKRAGMRLAVAASTAVRSVLAGPPQPAGWLGASAAALYLQTAGRPGVLAILAHDAVRLPCGLLLPQTSGEMPLSGLAPPGPASARCTVGGGAVSWVGPVGPVEISPVRQWAPVRVSPGAVVPAAVALVQAALPDPASAGVDGMLLAGLGGTGQASPLPLLLGSGPGLTPSGDDVLAGFLVGARAFGLEVAGLRREILRRAPDATTALSAALLWHAARGECVDQVAATAAALSGRGAPEPAVASLLAVGHTSGGALAWGLTAAAERALRERRHRLTGRETLRTAPPCRLPWAGPHGPSGVQAPDLVHAGAQCTGS
jgi:hypothetical protein